MAKPPAPHLNAFMHQDWNRHNDYRTDVMLNPGPHGFYPGLPIPWKAPPPGFRAPYGHDVLVKAPPLHLAKHPAVAVRRDFLVIKAPPAHVFNAQDHLLQARAPHVMAVLEQPRPKTQRLLSCVAVNC